MEQKDLRINWHACAFLDLLGQKEELRKFESLPLHIDLSKDIHFLQLVNNTYSRVRGFHDNVHRWSTSFDGYSGKGVPNSQRKYWKKLTAYKTKYVYFSDGVLIDISLELDRELLPIHGVVRLLMTCANMMIVQLASNSPIRGGIDVGHAAYLGYNVQYGPAISRAYNLENDVAQYPRIVIGQSLMLYLNAHANICEDDARNNHHITNIGTYTALTRQAASIANHFIAIDSDGNHIVNYLSPYLFEGYDKSVARTLISSAHQFAYSQWKHWSDQRNTKLAFRYTQLLAYFEQSLPKLRDFMEE